MIYTNITVTLPDIKNEQGFEVKDKGNGVRYLYYTKNSHRDKHGNLKHNRHSIGRIVTDEVTELDVLMPNDKYYSFYAKTNPPAGATLRGVGRPKTKEEHGQPYQDHEVYAFGYMLSCYLLAHNLGLDDILKQSFGTKVQKEIMAVASAMASKNNYGLSMIEDFTQKHYCFTQLKLTSPRLSELYGEISEESRKDFFSKWVEHNQYKKFVCYDVSSVSSYAKNITVIAWGYNRDKEKLPQFNLGLFCDMQSKLPLYYQAYNGSLNDFSNLPYVLDEAIPYGLTKQLTLVMDGGFCLEQNLELIYEKGITAIMGAPLDFGVGIREQMVAWLTHDDVKVRENVLVYHSENFYYHETEVKINSKSLRLILFKSSASRAREESSLASLYTSIEQELTDKSKISEKLVEKYSCYFDIDRKDDGSFTFEFNQSKYNESLQLCGCFGLITNNQKLKAVEILKLYREKNTVEESFASIKNDILGERMYVSKDTSLHGKLFIAFIALIIRKQFKKLLGDYVKKNRLNLDGCLMLLSDLKCVKRENRWFLQNRPTKRQRELLECLKLDLSYIDGYSSL